MRGCGGKDDRLADAAEAVEDPREPLRAHVRLAVDRRDDVRPGLEAEPLEDLRALARDRRELEARVRHHVADDLDPPRDALAAQDRGGALVRRQEQLGDAVDRDPVPLLRHREVAAPQPGLDVRDRDLAGRLRARERRVRVAVDEHPVRALGLDDAADRRLHRRRVGRPQVEPVRGLGQAELVEEDGGHLRVPVLPRVQDDLVEARRAQRDATPGPT